MDKGKYELKLFGIIPPLGNLTIFYVLPTIEVIKENNGNWGVYFIWMDLILIGLEVNKNPR